MLFIVIEEIEESYEGWAKKLSFGHGELKLPAGHPQGNIRKTKCRIGWRVTDL